MSPDASIVARPLGSNEQHGYFLEDLTVGMKAVYGKTVTDADIVLFSGVSGDTNPLHLDHEFASRTMFGGPIVHGMLTASLISTVVGTRLPGPGCIYLSQNLRFRAPVRVGDTVLVQDSGNDITVMRVSANSGGVVTLVYTPTQSAANVDTSGATLTDLETEVNEIKAALRTAHIIAG